MTLIDIVEEGLKIKGFDGLVNDNYCGCKIGDLSPNDCINNSCDAAYIHHAQDGINWVMSTKKN